MTTPTGLPVLADAVVLTRALPRRSFVVQVMGLPVSVHVRGPAARGPQVAAAVGTFVEALRADDAMFSTWRPSSPVSRIRRGELALADAPTRVQHAALACAQAGDRTGGAFCAWLPDRDGRVRFDPTGLVKGWAVQQAFDRLGHDVAAFGAHDLLCCAGGDVAVRCTRTDTPDWQIGVQDPLDRDRTLLTAPLRTGAVATSGTAARGAHLIDPATGLPATGLLQATVIGPSLTWADVDATAAFVLGARAPRWLRTDPTRVGALVCTDGEVIVVEPPDGRPVLTRAGGPDAGARHSARPR